MQKRGIFLLAVFLLYEEQLPRTLNLCLFKRAQAPHVSSHGAHERRLRQTRPAVSHASDLSRALQLASGLGLPGPDSASSLIRASGAASKYPPW